jgi:putative ABC transport system permease protein
MLVAVMGIVVGLAAVWPAGRLLRSLLFEVEPFDPAVFAVVATTLATVALAASYIPARRATRVDPLIALRPE